MEKPQQRNASSRNRDRHNERGMSLVESIIGLLVLTIVLLAAAQLLRVNVQHLAMADRARRADVQANATMNTLATYNLSALPDGNPFRNKATITQGTPVYLDNDTCLTAANCDQVVQIPRSGTESTYINVGWNQPLPTNGSVTYYRAWKVETLDAEKGLRRITLAIIPAEPDLSPATDAMTPLVLRQTDVVQRQ
jgi:Tfp pilus assembly protein PilV